MRRQWHYEDAWRVAQHRLLCHINSTDLSLWRVELDSQKPGGLDEQPGIKRRDRWLLVRDRGKREDGVLL